MEVREDEKGRGREGESAGKFSSHGAWRCRGMLGEDLTADGGAVLCVGLGDEGALVGVRFRGKQPRRAACAWRGLRVEDRRDLHVAVSVPPHSAPTAPTPFSSSPHFSPHLRHEVMGSEAVKRTLWLLSQ